MIRVKNGSLLSRMFSQSNQKTYDLKSAMHIPLLVLGMTESTCKLTQGLIALKEFDPDEIEFIHYYASALKMAKGDDPDDPSLIMDKELRNNSIPTTKTLTDYCTGVSDSAAMKVIWTDEMEGYIAKGVQQVTAIDVDNQLITAIGHGERTTFTYTYESLILSSEYAQ